MTDDEKFLKMCELRAGEGESLPCSKAQRLIAMVRDLQSQVRKQRKTYCEVHEKDYARISAYESALRKADTVIELLPAFNVGMSFLSEERVEKAMDEYRAAREKIKEVLNAK